MKRHLVSFIASILLFSAVKSQTVTLKPIGKETVLFSDVFVTAYNNNLYTIENTGALYKTNLTTGAHTRLGNVTYKNTRGIFIVNAKLYCLEDDGSMNMIDIETGAWTVVSPINTWKDANRVVIIANRFYTTQNGALFYHPTMDDRLKKQMGEQDFFDMGNYMRTDTSLYTLIGGTLWNINLQTWKWKKVGANKGWKNARDGEIIANKMYTIESNTSLYETDLGTAEKKLLDDKQFLNCQVLITDFSGKLFAIFKGGALYEVVVAN